MAPVTSRWGSWKFENYQKWSRGVLPSWQSPPNDQNYWFRLRLRSKRTKIAILPLFSIVFYSKTIGKQKKLSEWVSPERSRSEFWHKASSDSVDSNCKCFLETYFVSLNPITRLPREVVDLTACRNWLGGQTYEILDFCGCNEETGNQEILGT